MTHEHAFRFYPPDMPVPDRLIGPEFTLRPLTPEHVEIDYQAVMESRHMLRVWSGSGPGGWPADDFTLEGNLEDLRRHAQEHAQGLAYTYTVLDPGEANCLGCVYINPLAVRVRDNPEALAEIGDDEAVVGFWVVSSRLADGLDGRLLASLMAWFGESWHFRRLYFHVHEAHRQQQALLEAAGLRHQYRWRMPRRSGWFYFYPLPGLQ